MKHKFKRIIDFLKIADLTSLDAVVWSKDDDEDPLWEGPIYDMPWWVAQEKLDYNSGNEAADNKPIEYRGVIKSDRAGFIICVK